MMKLFLCEKPSQAKDIGKVLGVLGGRDNGFFRKGNTAVTWCFGHMLANAMPAAYGEIYADFGNTDALPLLPDKWLMEVSDSAAKQFKVIRTLLAEADEVVIATDADREGEVIGREILEYCGYRGKVSRFWTSGLDAASVKKALGKIMPGGKTETLYQAGLARSRADWLVGMNLSRAYTAAYAEGRGKAHTLSVGRIQTPTLALVVRRDAAIDTFKPYPYYTLRAVFQVASGSFEALWQIPDALKNQDGLCTDQQAVDKLAATLPDSSGRIAAAKTERKHSPPPLPYSLSALQKAAGNRFGLSPDKVLDIAQALYEKHKITSYPRSPCRYLPKSQQAEVPAVFAAMLSLDPSLGNVLKQADPARASRVWNDGQVNKHSHHAIIPTTQAGIDLSKLSKAERDIYLMIRNRYIAQFYPDCEYDSSTIEVECCGHRFRTVGRQPVKPGWKSLLGEEAENEVAGGDEEGDSAALPPVDENEAVRCRSADAAHKKTVPPPRFTEPSLLDEMQTLSDFLKTVDNAQIKKVLRATEGLGTEATRANILKRLYEMGYLEKKGRKVSATDKGKRLISLIPEALADPVTTAKWELALGGIESGKLGLAEFMHHQSAWISRLVAQAKADLADKKKAAPTGMPATDRKKQP
ncbi:DNA topoisomerase 3 [Eikenella halliae]|nr:DNA topoisomerase 3 [Eikenella halliae]